MSWNSNTHASDNEMYPMTSTTMHEDSVRVRLLSVSDDEGQERIYTDDIPSLSLRSETRHAGKPLNDKKSRCAAISVLVVGLFLILVINIGVAMRLKQGNGDFHFFTPTKPTTTNVGLCNENKLQSVKCDDAFPWKKYRLPDTIHPELYSILIHPDLTAASFKGSVDISLHVAVSTKLIVLHSKALNLSDISVLVGAKKTEPHDIHFCDKLGLLAIVLPNQLTAGEKATLHIDYSGSMHNSLRGFYMSKYQSKLGENYVLGTTQFESTDARKSFPCFDEPNFKAKFALSIIRPNNYTAISNMPIANTEHFSSESMLDHFQTTLPMSTYLVAFIVSKFKHISRVIAAKNGNLTVSVYSAHDRIDTAEYALNVSCDVILFYEKLFEIPYPLPKLDLVAIPDFEAGAMENWGLVTYRETAVLADELTSSTAEKEYVALVIAHELAHQWFGNLVTMKWWNDLWLNEGFASFMEYYAIDKIYPSWKYMNGFHRYHTTSAMSTDQSQYTHPISVPVDSATQIESVFDDISYSKGASVIMMMVDYIGEHTFLKGVTNYLNKFAYNNTENMDLIDVVSIEAEDKGKNIPTMLKSWTSQAGFPIVNVSLNGGVVHLEQKRYLLNEDSSGASACGKHKESIWQIPISYKTNLDSAKKWHILETKTGKFALHGEVEWITLNVNRGGYYLVNYHRDVLSNIIKQLKKNHLYIDESDREGIIYNVLKSAKVGLLPYDSVFDLISYATAEKSAGPLRLIGNFVSQIAINLKEQFQDEAVSKIQTHGWNIFKELYQQYGWPKMNQTTSHLSHSQIKLQRFVIAKMCHLDYENCTTEAIRRFHLWKSQGVRLNPDLKSVVYNTAVRLGSNEDWEFLWKRYTTDPTIDVHEKTRLRRALCSTQNQKNILTLLSETLKDKLIRTQNIGAILGGLQSTQVGSMLTWKFLRNKWTELLTRFPFGSNSSRKFFNIFYTFTDSVDIAAAEEFISENNLTETQFVKRSLDKAKFRIRWLKTALPQVVNWLNSNVQ